MYLKLPRQPALLTENIIQLYDILQYHTITDITFKIFYSLMLLLNSRRALMMILFPELIYYSINRKRTPICLEPKRTPTIILYIDIDLNKPIK